MPCLRRYPLLLALLLIALLARAQTPLGQPTLDEQKATIWCAAIRFVYDDTGAPELKNTLRCGSLKALENSIKADKQGVYSKLYQPLEGRGTMYKGLGSDKSRLTKLKDEIINKLQASPARRQDPARMRAVQALAASLTSYVESGTPPGDVSSALNAEAAPDTSADAATDEATAAAPADAGPSIADNPNYAPPAAPGGAGESLMSKLFAPLAFILALLSIVLYVLLRRNIAALMARTDRHRAELESVKGNSLGGVAGSGAFSAKRLTPEMEAEVARIVQQRVAEALAQPSAPIRAASGSIEPRAEALGNVAPQRPASNATPAGTPRPSQPQPQNRSAAQGSGPGTAGLPAPAPTPPPAPAPPAAPAPAGRDTPAPTPSTEAPAPAGPASGAAAGQRAEMALPAFENIASAPSAYSPPAAPHLEMPIPAGPPSAAPRDEFDSLVPPVQLPAPESYAAVAAAPAPRYYAKVPVNGGFSAYDLQAEPQHDSIYELLPDPRQPDTATFRINPDPAVHAYAIQSAQYSLRDACRYQQPAGPTSRIVTDEPGTLRKVGGTWQVEQKAVIHFE